MASPRASDRDRPNVLKPKEKGGSNSANRANGSDTVKPFSRGEVDVYLLQDRSPLISSNLSNDKRLASSAEHVIERGIGQRRDF